MKKTFSWLGLLGLIVVTGLVVISGAMPLPAAEGWCCKDGVVFAATPEQCKEKGGAWFASEAEAKRYCEQPPATGWCCKDGVVFAATPELCKEKGGAWFASEAEAKRYCEQPPATGWCCKDGVVFAATPELCKRKGGVYFATEAEARKYCEQPPATGWCCKDGMVFAATPEQCKEKGGMYFATKPEAEKYCRIGNKLPDLIVRDIALNRRCQVVVTVGNAGPGMVPDEVWTVHKPTSCSVYLYINGQKWGGGTVWGFDPGKLLQPPGGTARYVSKLVVGSAAEITALIDHTGEVTEVDETNNKWLKN